MKLIEVLNDFTEVNLSLNAKIFTHDDDVNVSRSVPRIATDDHGITTDTGGLTTVHTFSRHDARLSLIFGHLVCN